MKRVFSILLITVLLVGLMPVIPNVAMAASYATITSENGLGVNLREGPGTGYKKIDSYPVGTAVEVLQQGSEWSQIQLGGSVTGWMMSRYLIFGAGGSIGSSTGSTNAYVVSDNGLRVWLRASAGGTRLFLNAAGTPVEVISYDSEWCYIRIGATYGYMKTKYLSVGQQGGDGITAPTVTSGRVTKVEINYTHPVVLDTLEAIVTSPDAQVDYEWYVRFPVGNPYYPAGAEVLLGTEATFEVLTRYADCQIQVKVTGKDGATGSTGSTGTATSDWTAPVQISKGLKSVEIDKEGAPVVGETLSALLVPSSALGDYSWRVGGVEVSTESTYTVQEGDVGKLIQLRVTGIGGYVGTVACSADDVVVSNLVLQSVELNKLNPIVGETLSATVLPEGAQVTYKWMSDGEVLSDKSTYKVVATDLGKNITLEVTGAGDYTGKLQASTKKVANGKLQSVSLSGSAIIGDTVYAKVNPASSAATYWWYIGEVGDGSNPVQKGILSSLTLDPATLGMPKEDMIDEVITVRAYPAGVYTVDGDDGYVEAKMADTIQTDKQIYTVKLLNTTPTVGEKIEVELTPENADDDKDSFSYVWYIDTETDNQHGSVYTVKASDIGKKIRVKVVGTGEYAGEEAYSAWTTKAVVDNSKITGVRLYTVLADGTEADVTSINPVIGDTVYAQVLPKDADPHVTYTWKDGKGHTFTNHGNAFDITKSYLIGSRLEVIAEVANPYDKNDPEHTSPYSGKVNKRTATIKAADDLFYANFKIAEPVAGITPVYSATGTYTDAEGKTKTVASATIEWQQYDAGEWDKATFDKFGHFQPGETYSAKLTIKPTSNVSLYNAKVTVNGSPAVQDEDNDKIFYSIQYNTTAQMVTDFYITDLEAPKFGGSTWIGDIECGNTQVTGKVKWDHKSQADGAHLATITLTAKEDFTLDGVPLNAFKVSGADSTVYNGEYDAGAETCIIYARYYLDHELVIDTDKSEVYLDGFNRVIVQCAAHVTNYVGEIQDILWEIVSVTKDGTSINQDGLLVIGMYETPDRNLTVRATVTIEGEAEPLVATKDIPLITGDETDTAINITFTKYSTALVRDGDSTTAGFFEATVSNSTEGCMLFVFDGTQGDTPSAQAADRITIDADDFPSVDKIVIKAISNEDHSVTANLLVDIVDTEELAEDGFEFYLVDETVEILASETTEEVIEEPVVEITEEIVEEPVAELTEEEIVEEPVIELTEEIVEEPVIELTEEEVVEEPVIEITEEIVEEPVIETVEEIVEEPVAEITEEVVEEEVIDASMILIKDTVSGEEIEIIEETAEETAEEIVEEPVVEEVEVLDDVTIAIKDTVTGEVVEEDIPVNSEKPVADEKEEAKAEEKADDVKEEELTEEIPDEELDALEGEDIGKSVENEAQIVISFIKTASEVKRGGTAEFAAEIEGSDAGVQWILRRSKNADGKVVSTISQDGVLTVSADETADKLVVIAAAAEDTTIRARWIVAVPQKSASSSSKTEEAAEMIEELVEETVTVEQPEAVLEETVEEIEIEEEIVAEDEGLSDDILKRIEEELRMLEEQQSVLNFF